MTTRKTKIGVVVIGRNEGERLVACFQSLKHLKTPVVYVDSGSTDDSLAQAKKFGFEAIELDLSIPFSAARARNEGYKRLKDEYEIDFVQFIDGDCTIDPKWSDTARSWLEENLDYAVAFGRRREKHPEKSVYNMLCDEEWNVPIGDADACGGDTLMRSKAFEECEGFNPSFVAGEEPELCVRFRKKGWKIRRLDLEMTSHDADIHQFSQWWRRCKRSGFASALGFHTHGAPPEELGKLTVRRALIWALVIPLGVFVSTLIFGAGALLLLFVYPIQVIRLALRNGISRKESWQSAFFLTLSKFPEFSGIVKFYFEKSFNKKREILEYK